MLRKFNLHFNFESSIYSKLNKLKPCQVPFILQQFVQGQVVDFTYLLELLHRLPYTDVLLYRNHLGAVWRMNICSCTGYHSFAKNIGHASRICFCCNLFVIMKFLWGDLHRFRYFKNKHNWYYHKPQIPWEFYIT